MTYYFYERLTLSNRIKRLFAIDYYVDCLFPLAIWHCLVCFTDARRFNRPQPECFSFFPLNTQRAKINDRLKSFTHPFSRRLPTFYTRKLLYRNSFSSRSPSVYFVQRQSILRPGTTRYPTYPSPALMVDVGTSLPFRKKAFHTLQLK